MAGISSSSPAPGQERRKSARSACTCSRPARGKNRRSAMNHSEIVSFIWSVADLIRDTFKRGKYQDVILPLTVFRRIDCVLEPTKPNVLETYTRLKGRLENLAPQLCRASGFAFYNTSPYTFERLLADAPHLAANLR